MLVRLFLLVVVAAIAFAPGSADAAIPERDRGASIVVPLTCTLQTSCLVYQTLVAYYVGIVDLLQDPVPILDAFIDYLTHGSVPDFLTHVDYILRHSVPHLLDDARGLLNTVSDSNHELI